MRILLTLVFVVSSVGAMTTFDVSRTTDRSKLDRADDGNLTGAVSMVRRSALT